jgi:hypothetical protein
MCTQLVQQIHFRGRNHEKKLKQDDHSTVATGGLTTADPWIRWEVAAIPIDARFIIKLAPRNESDHVRGACGDTIECRRCERGAPYREGRWYCTSTCDGSASGYRPHEGPVSVRGGTQGADSSVGTSNQGGAETVKNTVLTHPHVTSNNASLTKPASQSSSPVPCEPTQGLRSTLTLSANSYPSGFCKTGQTGKATTVQDMLRKFPAQGRAYTRTWS